MAPAGLWHQQGAEGFFREPELGLVRQRRGGLAERAVCARLAVAHLGPWRSGRGHAHLAHEEYVGALLLHEGPQLIAVGVNSRQQRVRIPHDNGSRLFGRHLFRRLLAFRVAVRTASTRKELRDAHRCRRDARGRDHDRRAEVATTARANFGGAFGQRKSLESRM